MNAKPIRDQALVPVGDKNKLAAWFFLGSEIILFGALIVAFGAVRLSNPASYSSFKSHLSIPLIAANTFVLILSSYFVALSVEAARAGRQAELLRNLVIVFALGSLFIVGQAYEWSTLFGVGIGLYSTFGAPFFIVTGIHGAHVLIGLAWASIVLLTSLPDSPGGWRGQSVEIFGLYWHFVDIVWIVLFSVIYLL